MQSIPRSIRLRRLFRRACDTSFNNSTHAPMLIPDSRPCRRARRGLFQYLLVFAITLSVIAQAPAQNYPGAVSYLCEGNEVQNFMPPLTSTVEDHVIHVQATLSCRLRTSKGKENFAHLSYDYSTPPIPLSCTTPLSTGLGTSKFTWHFATEPLNRANSTFRFERTVTSVIGNPVYTLNGDITNGMFQGATGAGTTTILATDQLTNCLTGGSVDKLLGEATFIVEKLL